MNLIRKTKNELIKKKRLKSKNKIIKLIIGQKDLDQTGNLELKGLILETKET